MSSPSTSSQPSTSYWQRAWDDAQPQLQQANDTLRSLNIHEPSARVLRVSQLDAELLDQELVQLLQTPLTKALGLLSVCFYRTCYRKLVSKLWPLTVRLASKNRTRAYTFPPIIAIQVLSMGYWSKLWSETTKPSL